MPPILIVGEAYGQHEEALGHPFVGPAGRQLIHLLIEANILPRTRVPYDPPQVRDFWLSQTTVALTNVFNLRPENNDVETLCTSAAGDRIDALPLRTGKYVRRGFQSELNRLATEINQTSPNLIIALGGTASWALLGDSGISRVRGAVAPSMEVTGVVHKELPTPELVQELLGFRPGTMPLVGAREGHLARSHCLPPTKILPTFHPAAILRDWSLRHVTVMDLHKAKREAAFPEIRRPERFVYIEPTLADMEWYWNEWLREATLISCDIETQGNNITCIGFAPDKSSALVVPFRDQRKAGYSYWPTAADEAAAWRWVKKVCESGIPLLFQNGMYDSHFLWKVAGIRAPVTQDTMLLHHSLQPEAKKGLGYLGACYTNEASWKLLNAEKKSRKKDD